MTPKKDGLYTDAQGNKLKFVCGTVEYSMDGLVMKFQNQETKEFVFLRLHECDALRER